MPPRLLALLLAAVATTLIAAGCGGDDDETSSDDFVAEVTAACDDAGTQLGGALASFQESGGDTEDLTQVVEDEVLPVYKDLQSNLEDITPPEDDADTWDDLLANLDETISLAEDDPAEYVAAAQGEQNDVTQRAEELEAESDSLAAELGVPENCGEPSGTTGATGPTGAEGSG